MSNSTDEIATCRVLNCVISRETLSRVKRNEKKGLYKSQQDHGNKNLLIYCEIRLSVYSQLRKLQRKS